MFRDLISLLLLKCLSYCNNKHHSVARLLNPPLQEPESDPRRGAKVGVLIPFYTAVVSNFASLFVSFFFK